MGARPPVLPRSVWPLLALLLIAAVWLWRGGGGAAGPRPLFDVAPDGIRGLTARGPYGLTVLERGPGGWRLGGDRPDLADADEIAALLDVLTTTLRTAAIDDADLRRNPAAYGLDAGGTYELLLEADGVGGRLVVGAQNPASGLFYARFADSDALFMVGEDLVNAVHPLPDQVRARGLWPGFSRDDPDSVSLRFAGDSTWDLSVRDEGGRWWLREPADGLARVGDVARAYNARRADRRRIESGVVWLRMRDREMATLLSYLEEARVRDFLSSDLAPPSDGFGVRLDGGREVLYGELETDTRARAWRNGFADGIVLPGEVPRLCADGLARYLDTDLLDRALAQADSFEISRLDLGRARFVNADDHWRLSEPAEPALPADRIELMAGDLVHLLDRVPILAVLEPAADLPLRQPVITLQIWATGPGVPARVVLRCGLHADTGTPAAWYPDDGRVLAIDRDPVISCRTVLSAATGRGR